jgi:hypothetical protein
MKMIVPKTTLGRRRVTEPVCRGKAEFMAEFQLLMCRHLGPGLDGLLRGFVLPE